MNLSPVKELALTLMGEQHFDSLAIGLVDFRGQSFKGFQLFEQEEVEDLGFFDLASLTKPLTLSSVALLHPELFLKDELNWLLCHRASLPIGGRLSFNNWREQILSYPTALSPQDIYSDYSALRLMLELEKLSGKSLYELAAPLWSQEVLHWTQLREPLLSPMTGWRRGKPIRGVVHDDNAFVLKEKLSHAGLFGTLRGVGESLLKLTPHFSRIKKALRESEAVRRFVLGFDCVQDFEQTLAGRGAGPLTFGHLGFTGTSFWIDCEKELGWIMLSNATQSYWYQRDGLGHLRRSIGELIWRRA
jgi:CubicO group peptidase (beta-lactamase class C family)